MKKAKYNLLIIGSSQGHYGGIEAFMIAVAEAALNWNEFEVKLCFKLVKGFQPSENLKKIAEDICPQVYYVQRGSKQLMKQIAWADILHVQNTPPDIVFAASLMSKKIFLTVHNRRISGVGFHSFAWSIAIKLAHRRWFNSCFVWNTWEPEKKSSKSACVTTVCRLPKMRTPPEKRKGFLFIGRWIKNKGIEELLQAYALNKFNSKEWPLTLIGEGPLKQEVLALIEKLGLKEVCMPGFVDDTSKEHYLSSARWLLAPARTQEDLGLTPIEGRSVGVPSIVTRDGGLPESGGEAALIAEPGNIEDLAHCMHIAATMGEDEYQRRGELGYTTLAELLKPMDFYRNAYIA